MLNWVPWGGENIGLKEGNIISSFTQRHLRVNAFSFSFMCVCVSACVYTMCVRAVVHVKAYGGQKKWLDPLELEIQVIVSYPMWVPETNSAWLEEQQELLTVEPALQPLDTLF